MGVAAMTTRPGDPRDMLEVAETQTGTGYAKWAWSQEWINAYRAGFADAMEQRSTRPLAGLLVVVAAAFLAGLIAGRATAAPPSASLAIPAVSAGQFE